jgi:hypothetical protein
MEVVEYCHNLMDDVNILVEIIQFIALLFEVHLLQYIDNLTLNIIYKWLYIDEVQN